MGVWSIHLLIIKLQRKRARSTRDTAAEMATAAGPGATARAPRGGSGSGMRLRHAGMRMGIRND